MLASCYRRLWSTWAARSLAILGRLRVIGAPGNSRPPLSPLSVMVSNENLRAFVCRGSRPPRRLHPVPPDRECDSCTQIPRGNCRPRTRVLFFLPEKNQHKECGVVKKKIFFLLLM